MSHAPQRRDWQNRVVQQTDAIRLLATPHLDARTPQTWADLGCGDGVFTRARASLLAPR